MLCGKKRRMVVSATEGQGRGGTPQAQGEQSLGDRVLDRHVQVRRGREEDRGVPGEM